MTRIIGPPRSRRRHWTLLSCLAIALGIGLISIAGALGVAPEGNPPGFFELDKNAANDLTTPHLGVLGGNITAGASSFSVCELGTAPATPFTIMVDAEQMTVTSVATTTKGTGGCNFTNPADSAVDTRVWNVTRGVNSTTAAAHTNNDDITQLITGSVSGADWNQVYADIQANGPPSSTNKNPCSDLTGAVTCNFIHHPPGTSTFVQGTSDIADIPTWHWTPQSVPDADEISDAYAAKFTSPSVSGGDQFLYFGADRFASNGSKDFGFWFFKNSVGLKSDGTFVDDTGAPATHAVGDILLLGTFTNGGAVATIRVFKWVGSGGDTNGTLNSGGSFGDCVPGGSDAGCDTVNNTTIPSGALASPDGQWAYLGKSEPASNVIYTGGFMEGGIDLTPLGLNGCFSSFMAETRASPSLTAELKDLVLGKFEACGSSLISTPVRGDGTSLAADSNNNNLVEASIGSGTVSVKDSAILNVSGTDFTGNYSFHICGPIAAPATCSTGGVAATPSPNTVSGTAGTNVTIGSTAVTLSSVGRYCWRADFSSTTKGVPPASDSSAESGTPGTATSKTGECFEVLPATPSLVTTAVDCTASHTAITAAVPFGSTVCDKGVLSSAATQPGTGGGTGTDGVLTTYTTINAATFPAAGGKITFQLDGADSAGPPAVCSTTAASVSSGSNPQDVTVSSGNSTYFTTAIKPSSPGNYHWVAQYFPAAGDSNNNQSSLYDSDCSHAAESLTIQQVNTDIRTNQSWFPNDTAAIKSADSTVPLATGGTVDFFLYNSNNCTGTAKYAERFTIAAGDIDANGVAHETTHNYPNGGGTAPPTFTWAAYPITTLVTDAAGSAVDYSWKVVYTPSSTDGAHLGRQSACSAAPVSIEKFTITYTNDNSGGTAP
jgi:hypothetical protein